MEVIIAEDLPSERVHTLRIGVKHHLDQGARHQGVIFWTFGMVSSLAKIGGALRSAYIRQAAGAKVPSGQGRDADG